MSVSPSALDQLADRFALPSTGTRQLATLLDLLGRDPQAPTSDSAREAALDVHVADSLVALDLPVVRLATEIADVGSGPGFPGLALAAALPRARVRLVESSRRKCRFLSRAVSEARVRNASVVCARVEDWHEGIGSCDLVTARAVGPLAVVAEYAAPLLRVRGTLVAWKGARDAGEERDAAAAAQLLGLKREGVFAVQPYPSSRGRHLHVLRKVAETPGRFPRRAGAARKRALGAASEDSRGTGGRFDRDCR
jgi:16S rRNA (guanine527-N7)-methyltransferase